ncbi:Cyclophilin-type peptidyl-prolyl cis-trans isomerase domain [Dillenia turbinata]|uniref:Cyclophilin-type peptidyl-prolyl cis-trans isomerase domain n=1 Tax=Dillenia turbinata TaxID=194707 RepID=A0AAN8UZ02_9MAGN
MVNPKCYLDITIGGELEGTIVVELYADVMPKAVENIRALCTGEKGIGTHTHVPLHFKVVDEQISLREGCNGVWSGRLLLAQITKPSKSDVFSGRKIKVMGDLSMMGDDDDDLL